MHCGVVGSLLLSSPLLLGAPGSIAMTKSASRMLEPLRHQCLEETPPSGSARLGLEFQGLPGESGQPPRDHTTSRLQNKVQGKLGAIGHVPAHLDPRMQWDFMLTVPG